MQISRPISRSLARLPLEVPDGIVIFDGGYEIADLAITRSTVTNVLGPDGLLLEIPVNAWAHEYEPGGAYIGRRIEGERGNLWLRSEEFDSGTWTKGTSNATDDPVVTANQATAPDGTATADQVQITLPGDTEWALVRQNVAIDAVTHVPSIFLLANGGGQVGKKVTLYHFDGITFRGYSTITLTAEWQRMGGDTNISASASGTREFGFGKQRSSTIGATDAEAATDFFAWGSQLGVGNFPLSYVKTEGSSVVRAADVPTLASPPIPKTWLLDFRTAPGSGEQVIGQYDDTTEDNRYRVVRNASNEVRLFVTTGGVEQIASGLLGGTVANDTNATVVVRIDTNDFAITLNGAALVEDTAGSLPTVTTKSIGRDTVGNYQNSTSARDVGWPDPLSDDVMRSLAA